MRSAPSTMMMMHIDDWWQQAQWHSKYEEAKADTPDEVELLAEVQAERLVRIADKAKPYEQRLRERMAAKRAKK